MTAYNKLFAAIGATLLTRWLLKYTGIDVVALGVGDDLQGLVSVGIDAVAAGAVGAAVWAVRNIERIEKKF